MGRKANINIGGHLSTRRHDRSLDFAFAADRKLR